jgi:cyanamide hydratase
MLWALIFSTLISVCIATNMSLPSDIKSNGWTAISIDIKDAITPIDSIPDAYPYDVDDFKFPSDDPLVADAQAFAKSHLSEGAYNHSMRVYYWGEN